MSHAFDKTPMCVVSASAGGRETTNMHKSEERGWEEKGRGKRERKKRSEGEKEEVTHFVVREKTGEEPKGKRSSCACERGSYACGDGKVSGGGNEGVLLTPKRLKGLERGRGHQSDIVVFSSPQGDVVVVSSDSIFFWTGACLDVANMRTCVQIE
jgi:hypothetical protein